MRKYEELDRIISLLNTKGWISLSAEEKLSFLQEYEKVMAGIQGREVIPVRVIPKEMLYEAERDGGLLMGYYDHKANEMRINPRFLENRKSITGVSTFGLPQVLETIAHEGRHAWQHYVVEHPEKQLVDRATRLAMQMNFSCYCSGSRPGIPFSFYTAQLIELDARRYARSIIGYMSEKVLQKEGHLDLQFVSLVNKCEMSERMNASRLMKDVFTNGHSLASYEEMARKRMKVLCPGVDFSKVSMFSDALEFLEYKDMKKYVDGAYIRSSFAVGPAKSVQIPSVNEAKDQVKIPSVGEAKDPVKIPSVSELKVGKKHKLL